MSDYLTGEQVAAILGVSRKTVYRWAELGRIPEPWAWTHAALAPYVGIQKLPKGPPRRRDSRRYTVHRHRFEEMR